MSTLDVARRAAHAGRKAVALLGLRTTTVTIRAETYAVDIADGVAPTTQTDIVVTPTPKVVKLSDDKASMYGANPAGLVNGHAILSTYEVGPITPAFYGGGMSLAQLLPGTRDTKHRTLFVLSGDDFAGGSEVCVVVRADATKPLRTMLVVQRAPQAP